MAGWTASKSSLDEAKRLLAFSHSGYRILDRKRTVLMREFFRRQADAVILAEKVKQQYEVLRIAVRTANMSTGAERVMELVSGVAIDSNIRVLRQSVMGVELPHILEEDHGIVPSYGLFRSNESLDKAFQAAIDYKRVFYKYLEEACALRRLAAEIRRSGKRADSINKIQIPRYEARVKDITQAIEEKEREDLFRLKRSKQMVTRE